jgi:uroporphyrin-III C-methyltransferase/precorrin-2 dehydrogenase/sirohydrochlorin ferrochelatase
MPISLTTAGQNCLVVGGGKVAVRKVDVLMDYELAITVVAPEPDERLSFYAEKGMLKLDVRAYASGEATNYKMVVAASDDESLNQQVYDEAKAGGAIVNVVDNPPLCDFIFPAVLRRDCLSVALSTDGKAPFLSGHLRMVLENIFPAHWSKIARLAIIFRGRVRERWAESFANRSQALDRFLSADWKTMLKQKSEAEIEAELEKMLEPEAAEIDEK